MLALRCVSLSHHALPISQRQRLTLDAAGLRERICGHLHARGGEIVVLSTCNRFELYTSDLASPIQALVPLEFCNVAADHRGVDVVRHLFRVACGLESKVVGEHQILGQVGDAYALARSLGATGPVLDPVFQRAVAVGRATAVGRGQLGVGWAMVADVHRRLDLSGKRVLVVGAGKMSRQVLDALRGLPIGSLTILARRVDRARRFAPHGVHVGPIAELHATVRRSDVVFTATASSTPIFDVDLLRGASPIWIADLAVPRDVDADVASLPQITLIDVDHLLAVPGHSLASDELARIEQIVNDGVSDFVAWHRQRQLGPLIERLYRQAQEAAADDLRRHTSAALTPDELQRHEIESRQAVNRLMHRPIAALCGAQRRLVDDPADADALQTVRRVAALFKLPIDDDDPIDDDLPA
jgi:glutamyl-tRNA reductase